MKELLRYQSSPIIVEAARVNKKSRGQIAELVEGEVVIEVNANGEETGWSVEFFVGVGKNRKKVSVTTGFWVYRTVGRQAWNCADDELFKTRFPNPR